MARFDALLAALAVTALLAVPAGAQTYRFMEPDGTVHFTNTPTDPEYQWTSLIASEAVPESLLGPLQGPLQNLAPYAREIREAAERYQVEEGLIKAVIRVESGFNSRAVSPKGARGLMQLMPSTASMLGVRDSFDPRQNIDGGVRHLRGLIDRFNSDLKLALAAYNAGEQAVMNHRGSLRRERATTSPAPGFFTPTPRRRTDASRRLSRSRRSNYRTNLRTAPYLHQQPPSRKL